MTTENKESYNAEQLRNSLEARNSTPTYFDLSDSHKNDDMYALKKNVLRVQWKPTMSPDKTALDGQVQWNNIQPPNKKCGISNMYIKCSFTLAITGANADVCKLFDKDHLFMYDINAALYNTDISMSGQSLTGQPYIDLAIKRLYDPNFYTPSLINRSNDKNVYWTFTPNGTNATIKYECSSPLIHPFFSSDNDLAGINAFTINTRYNLTHLFNQYAAASTGAARTVSLSISQIDWSICYDQINYDKPLNDYMTLLMWEAYFTEKYADTDHTHDRKAFENNIRDIPSTPICQYTLAIRDINKTLFTNGTQYNIAQNASMTALSIPRYRLKKLDITVNSNSNAYNATSFMDIVHCCHRAGFKGETTELTEENLKYPPVYGISSLEYRNVVGTADTYRFNCSDSECVYPYADDAHPYNNYRIYYVMMQPALFMSSDTGSAFVNNLGVSFSEMSKSDSDVDAYIKLIEQSGYSGGSLKTWLVGLRDKLKRGRYISRAGHFLGNVMENPLLKQAASMIPVVGPALTTNWDTAKNAINTVADTAERLGYGVNMF